MTIDPEPSSTGPSPKASAQEQAEPQVAVVIPTRRRPALLAEALATVVTQEGLAEVVVIDDDTDRGPEPEAQAVVDALGDERVRYQPGPGIGPGPARNLGIESTSAALIAFLDDDDRLLPHSLTRRSALFAPGVGMVHGGVQMFDAVSDQVLGLKPARAVPDVHELMHECFVSTSAVMVRREAFDDVGTFSAELVGPEDWDMWLRIADRWQVVAAPGIHAEWRLQHASVSSSTDRSVVDNERLIASFATFHPDCRHCRRAAAVARRRFDRARVAALYAEEREADPRGAQLRRLKAYPRSLMETPVYRLDQAVSALTDKVVGPYR